MSSLRNDFAIQQTQTNNTLDRPDNYANDMRILMSADEKELTNTLSLQKD